MLKTLTFCRQLALVSAALIYCTFNVTAQTVCYVSPSAAPDGSYSQASPGSLAGLSAHLGKLRQAGKRQRTVYLLGGKYILKEPITLAWESTQKDTASVLITSAPGQMAELTGEEVITNWQSVGKGIFKAKVPPGLKFRQLYADGKMQVRSRYPNRENYVDFGPYLRVSRFSKEKQEIILPGKNVPKLKDLKGVELVMNQHWYQSRMRLSSLQLRGDSLIVKLTEPENKIMWGMSAYNMHLPGKPFYLENALSFLDAAEEWFLDEANNEVYFQPPVGVDINKLRITVPVTETLLRITGGQKPLRNLEIRNIAFSGSTWLRPSEVGSFSTQGVQQRGREDERVPGLIEVSLADNFKLTYCKITGVGAHGLVLAKGVSRSKVSACHFDQISADAIVIDTYRKPQQPDSLHCTQVVISDNLIENYGLHYTSGMGLLASNISKILVEHNEIRFGPYTGMQIGNHYGDNFSRLRENIIRYNNIHHVMQLHDDGGAIYTLSNQPGTKIYENWIHDYAKCAWADSYPVNGIFLDNNSSFIQVMNNVFSNLKDVDRIKENTGTNIHDNLFFNNAGQDPEIKQQAGLRLAVP